MKAFVAVSCLLAVAVADQSSHQVIKHGHGPAVSHAVHKPHGAHHALVSKTPAHPAAVHPVHPVHHAPVVAHPAPVVHPVHPAPAPYHAPAPAPYHAPAPAPYHAPAHPAPYHDEPVAAPVYQYGYAVADDYSGAKFAQNENRDNYLTNGEYRVALPDGRTQIVTYSVADAHSGYVADVKYEGEAHYDPAPAHPAKYAPVHPAPVHPVHPVVHPAPVHPAY